LTVYCRDLVIVGQVYDVYSIGQVSARLVALGLVSCPLVLFARQAPSPVRICDHVAARQDVVFRADHVFVNAWDPVDYMLIPHAFVSPVVFVVSGDE
jgi:hypothetical protein